MPCGTTRFHILSVLELGLSSMIVRKADLPAYVRLLAPNDVGVSPSRLVRDTFTPPEDA